MSIADASPGEPGYWSAQMQAVADENVRFPSVFRGAGAYRHYIPAIVTSVTSNSGVSTPRRVSSTGVGARRVTLVSCRL